MARRRLHQTFDEVQDILDAVDGKVDKVEGKGLSTNDYTDAEKAKLSSVEAGAEPNVQGDWDQADTTSDDYIKNKPDLSVKADLPLEDVDISGLTVRNGYITASGVWNSGSTYCHTLLPVSAGKAVRVTAAESNLFRYAWLTSGQAPRGGIAADLVPGTERTDVAAGSSVSLMVPEGAKYLYIYLGTPAAKANTPQSLAVSDTLSSLRSGIDGNSEDIGVIGTEIRYSGVYGHFDGAGSVTVYGGNIYVVAGMSYRLTMLHPDITVTDPTGNVWRLVVSARDDSGAVVSNLVQVSDVSRLSDHYDLTIPAGATRLYIYGRCAAGQTCDYVLERLDTQTYNDGDILTLNPDSEFQPKWQSAAKPYYTSQATNKPNCVRFLHLSDVHGNWANVRRFLKFYNHWVDKGYDITAINTGDTAADYLTDGVTGYTSIDGADKILGVIGNHDTRGTQGWQQYKGPDVYNALFAPLISGWGVVQPEGAATNGYCYYHKDYASNKLRLVITDVMGYDDTQDAWLASVLNGARSLGYHVLIATHFASGRAPSEEDQPPYDKISCQWSTMAGLASTATQTNGYNPESYKMADTVHAFMEAGGIFCGYMCGHSHLEFIARLDKYPDQMVYTVGSSKSGKVHDYTHTTGTRMQDEFEIVAVDTDSKFVKLYKVGANYDRRGRLKDSICVSYDTHDVVGFPVTSEGVKTINGQSILGSGNITIEGGSDEAVKYTEQDLTEAQRAQARDNIGAGTSDFSGAYADLSGKPDLSVYATETELNGKQDTISDLSTIRSGAAAGATAYQKPGTGIPATDMASGVQTSLGKADSAYQKPSSGIPASDLASGVIPTVPTALADLSDDSTHRLVTDTEKASWNARDFYFVVGSSSHAGNGSSGSYLSTKWEGTVPGVTTPTDGMKIAYRIKTNTGVATAGAVLSIDGGTTYHPVVFNVNSVITTRYSVGSTILITYNATQTAVGYLTSNTKSTLTGCWQIMDYDANTDTKVRQYQKGDNAAGTSPEYPILARYALTNKDGSYDANYAYFHTGATLNTTTGGLTAASFKKTGGLSSEFLKADGSVDSSTYLTAHQDISGKADKVSGATSGNLAALDSNGNLTDSGAKAGDFGTYSKPSGGIPSSDLASGVQTSLGKADTAYQKPSSGIPASDMASGVIPDISGKADKITVASSQPAGGFAPNVFYALGELSGDTTFTMAAATDNSILNHWYWTFDTPSTAPTITWPAAITSWLGGSDPAIAASTHYEISVINGVAAFMEV